MVVEAEYSMALSEIAVARQLVLWGLEKKNKTRVAVEQAFVKN